MKKLISCLLVLSMIASMFVAVTAEEADQTETTAGSASYDICTDENGDPLNVKVINGVEWVEEDGKLKMPAGPENSFLLFDTPLTTKRIEATIHPNDLHGNGDDRNGIVFALTDHDGDLEFNYDGADVSYYWACISGWEGRIQVLKMGKEDEKWNMISTGGWEKCGTPLAELGIENPADGVTLAAEWDNKGHIRVFVNGKLVEDITDTGTPLTGDLYGMLVRKWGNTQIPNTYDAPVTSFIAGGTYTHSPFECTYTVSNGEATITDVDWYISGDVTIPPTLDGYPVTSIGNYAFSDCSSLTSVVIPDSVTSIGSSAFEGCSSLTNITIPGSVTSIGEGAFEGCNRLEYNEYDNGCYLGSENNPYVVLVKSKSTDITSVNIHTDTMLIYDSAFEDCSSLASVVIPDSVTSIGGYAFAYCSSLTSVTIGNSVTSIGDFAFFDCSSLTSVAIPDSVTHIGLGAFSYCDSLMSVYITDIVAWFNIDFADSSANPLCHADRLYVNGVRTMKLVIPLGITEIKANAFYGCTGISEVIIPDGVTRIGEYAFYGCSSLTSITIPEGVTSIEYWTFGYCDSLTSITIPEGVTSIGDNAFYGCRNLTSITIPDSVTSIGSSAFADCYNLKDVYISSEAIWAGLKSGTAYGYLINNATTVYCDSSLNADDITTYVYVNYPYTATVVKDGITYTAYSKIEPHVHNYGTLVEEVPAVHTATELKAGMKAHYFCEGCNTYFTANKETTTKDKLVIAAPTHVDADNDGKCDDCGYNTTPVDPEDSPQLIMGSSVTLAGKDIVVTLLIKNNPGIAGLAVSLKYDESLLTLIGTESGGLFSGFTAARNFIWDESYDVVEDGILATFTFAVAEDAEVGDYSIEVIIRSCTNENLDDVELTSVSGTISVIDFVYGDANGDAQIDMKDVVIIRKYITNFDYDTNTSPVNIGYGADANGDGVIDMKDVVILRKYITNYDYDTDSSTVVLGPQQ